MKGDRHAVIIVAGGSGSRLGSEIPKQFLPLGGKPVLVHTVERFIAAVPQACIVVAVPSGEMQRWFDISEEYGITHSHTVCAGGANRFESVRNALATIPPCGLVAVHDGVRPLVSASLIREAFVMAQTHGTAVPVVEPSDSFRRITSAGSEPCDRKMLRAVQTPQVFSYGVLKRAYEVPYRESFTDDASTVEYSGTAITLLEGEKSNIKITTAEDMAMAEALLLAAGVCSTV